MVQRGGRSVSRHFFGKPIWRRFVFLGFWVDFGPRPLSPIVASNALHSFGHLIQHCATSSNSTMLDSTILDDAAIVWPGL